MSASRGVWPHIPPRWRDGVWELRCRTCGDWWPLTTDFYHPKHGVARCKACWSEYFRHKEAVRRARPEEETGLRATRRAKYFGERAMKRRAYCRAWRARNPEKVAAYNRIYRERQRLLRAA